ncbi:hypothetical protein R3P38DRAFT_3200638 [Favolaschia claudopus]|uniref:Uncharacterized protein n=1 Tax=Favolaschia claudopus TaxID=2862362 RepID=A0AAW0AY72_9AGAR
MSQFTFEAGAALIFLVLYLLLFIFLLFKYINRSIQLKSRWTVLFLHILIRLASQGCGIGFGLTGFANTGLFLAFLVLGAEGYFSLVLCTFRFLIAWHEENLPSHTSWLEPLRNDPTKPKPTSSQRTIQAYAFLLLGPFALFWYPDNAMAAIHSLLLYANLLIVLGGAFLSKADFRHLDAADTIMRTTGQGVFLACNAVLLGFVVLTALRDRRKRGVVHPTLVVLFVVWFPLIVRGAFGVLQAADFKFSYYNPDNYDAHGFTRSYTLMEYLLGVTTEWLACFLLCCTYHTSKVDSQDSMHDLKRFNEGDEREDQERGQLLG